MTAAVNNNGGNQLDIEIGGVAVATFDSTGLVGVKDGSIDADALATAVKPIGVGQTWQNMTASRSGGGTVYTNSTGRAIAVYVSLSGASAATAYISFNINGALCGYGSDAGGVNGSSAASFIVPDGATYSVQNALGTFSTLLRWAELR